MGRMLNGFTESDSITLFWEKPETAEKGDFYRIYIDGTKAGETDRTHYCMEGLENGREYQAEVRVLKCGGPEESLGTLPLKTGEKKRVLDVSKAPYLALGDGESLNTEVLQQVIDDCTENDLVYIPAGIFVTGALRLHSDMELYLEQGAVLQGTDHPGDYLPRISSRFEGLEMECYSSLLNLGQLDHTGGYSCRNVVIRGKGTIASGGRALAEKVICSERERLREYLKELGDGIEAYENADTIPGRVRPRLLNISNCQDIRISGLTLMNGASWNVHMIYSDQIITNDCVFRSEGVWNGDGWDPDSSTNCTIFGCTFYTGDDSIAIKSGKNPEGNRISRPCEHIRIFDCRSVKGHGIAMGSEMSGGISDVSIWDCDLTGSRYGIEIKGTEKRGGYVRNIRVRDCSAPRIMVHAVEYNDDGIAAPQPTVFEGFRFDNIYLTGMVTEKDGSRVPCKAIELCGFDKPGHALRDVAITGLKLSGDHDRQKITLHACENIELEWKTGI